MDNATHEGRAAFILGSRMENNPYRKAMAAMRRGKVPSDPNDPYGYNDARFAGLMDLSCQWDSGYAIAKRQ